MRTRHLLTAGLTAGLAVAGVLTTLGTSFGATAAASASSPPLSVSLSVSTSQLPATGGSVVVHLDFQGAARCRLYAPTQVRGWRRWGSCTGSKVERLWLPAQGSSSTPLSYRLLAVGTSPGERASSAATVVVGRQLSVLRETSSNWTGEIAEGAHSEVGASWAVPAVTGCDGTATSYSSTWVGLGTSRIVQGGTYQACDPSAPGGVAYTAFTEAYPAGSVIAFPVAPGDQMRAVAIQVGGIATITVTDLSSGASVSRSFTEQPPLQGAEWVEEDPATSAAPGAPFYPLADFGHVNLNSMSLDGALPTASAARFDQLLVDGTSLKMLAGSSVDRLLVTDAGT